jgi:hypothetical protein
MAQLKSVNPLTPVDHFCTRPLLQWTILPRMEIPQRVKARWAIERDDLMGLKITESIAESGTDELWLEMRDRAAQQHQQQMAAITTHACDPLLSQMIYSLATSKLMIDGLSLYWSCMGDYWKRVHSKGGQSKILRNVYK